MPDRENLLYYGDNLEVLRDHIPNESVDLIYLDPPFNSNRNYNILFKDRSGQDSEGQIMAFEDTWTWDHSAAHAYQEIVESPHVKVSQAMQAFRTYLGENDMMAYLANMAVRLVELHRVLKPTGSIYLHCDPTASHYLKILMDAVFGPLNFRNEIIWKRSHPHGNVSRSYGSIHDTLLFYSKTSSYLWCCPHIPYFADDGSLDPALAESVLGQYSLIEKETGRRFQATSLLNPNPNRPNLTYEFHGHKKVWRWTKTRMEKAEKDGHLYFPRKGAGVPREKRYLDEQEGIPVQDMWDDVKPIPAQAAERLGYPTQKPEALLERIILASSNEGATVLDPFCGCGTTISVAERLERRWIGIDITHLAVGLIKHRLYDQFKGKAAYRVIGEPVSVSSAWELASTDPFGFESWALDLVDARKSQTKKGADRGIDGRLYFHDEPDDSSHTKQIIFQVKAGKLHASYVRDLRGVIERDSAEIGVLISIDKPTKKMRTEAAAAGFYTCPFNNEKYPRLQLLTIDDVFHGKSVQYPGPSFNVTLKNAPRAKRKSKERDKDLFT